MHIEKCDYAMLCYGVQVVYARLTSTVQKDALSKVPLLVILLNVCLLEDKQIFTPLVTNQIK